MSVRIELQNEHGYLLIVIGCIALHIIMVAFTKVMKTRRQIFTKDFMLKHYNELHKKTFEVDLSKDFNDGYPDMGDGFYSQNLSYNQWLLLNKTQRAHYNYLEIIASILVVTFIAGFYYPCLASIFGLTFIIGRELYAQFYITPQGTRHPLRQIGVLTAIASFVVNFGLALYTGVKIAKFI